MVRAHGTNLGRRQRVWRGLRVSLSVASCVFRNHLVVTQRHGLDRRGQLDGSEDRSAPEERQRKREQNSSAGFRATGKRGRLLLLSHALRVAKNADSNFRRIRRPRNGC